MKRRRVTKRRVVVSRKKTKRGRGTAVEEAALELLREGGKKVASKVIPVPNILAISNVAQTLTDLIKKKPAPYLPSKYSAHAQDVRQQRAKRMGDRIRQDQERKRKNCLWPYTVKPKGWKPGQPCGKLAKL